MDLKEQGRNFLEALENVDAKSVCNEGYARTYLQHLLTHKEYYVAIYSSVLIELQEQFGERERSLCIVDYGCGNGLLGLFALQCGFGSVIFQDSDDEFLAAAERLSNILGFKNAQFIAGDIDNLLNNFANVDAVIGTDVIEHIYDLDQFFETVRVINSQMVTVFTTAANPYNPVIVSRLKKLQRRDEYSGNDGLSGDLSGGPHLPYFEMRKRYIMKNFPAVENVTELARATRGLAAEDIIAAVKKYQLTNRLPVPVHSTNTCNPVTGSWTERLLNASHYNELYNKHGFRLHIKAGFYNRHKSGAAGLVYGLLNVIVAVLGKTFSPFIILSGSKK